MTRRFPLHVHISTLFIALILLVGGVIGGLGYRISSEILETTASELNTRVGRETAAGSGDIGILGERGALEKGEDDAAGVEEGDPGLAARRLLPAKRGVESAADGEVGDPEGDETDGLAHVSTSPYRHSLSVYTSCRWA